MRGIHKASEPGHPPFIEFRGVTGLDARGADIHLFHERPLLQQHFESGHALLQHVELLRDRHVADFARRHHAAARWHVVDREASIGTRHDLGGEAAEGHRRGRHRRPILIDHASLHRGRGRCSGRGAKDQINAAQ